MNTKKFHMTVVKYAVTQPALLDVTLDVLDVRLDRLYISLDLCDVNLDFHGVNRELPCENPALLELMLRLLV